MEKIKITKSPDKAGGDFRGFARPETKLTDGIESTAIEIAGMAMFKLAKKVYENAAAYDWLISDDASGRIVTLFLKKIIDQKRKERGLSKAEINFVTSGRGFDTGTHERAIYKNLKSFLGKAHGKNQSRRAILITEYIQTGNTMKMLIGILQELKIDFDVAALSIEKQGLKRIKKISPESKIYFGDQSTTGLVLHKRNRLSGVIKRDPGTGSSFPEKTIVPRYNSAIEQQEIQKEINQTRKDLILLAENTIKILKNQR